MSITHTLHAGIVTAHCEEHFSAELDWKGNDEDGMSLWTCPAGHTVIEEN